MGQAAKVDVHCAHAALTSAVWLWFCVADPACTPLLRPPAAQAWLGT